MRPHLISCFEKKVIRPFAQKGGEKDGMIRRMWNKPRDFIFPNKMATTNSCEYPILCEFFLTFCR